MDCTCLAKENHQRKSVIQKPTVRTAVPVAACGQNGLPGWTALIDWANEAGDDFVRVVLIANAEK